MDTRCVLCDEPIGLRAIGAMVATGNVEHPDVEVVCRTCAARPERAQRQLREDAMVRMMLAGATVQRSSDKRN